MNEIKCPNCGAGIDSDGSFCKYCGVKLPDNTQKIEVSGSIDHNLNWVNQAKIARIEKKAEAERWEREHYKQVKRNENFQKILGFIVLIALVILIGWFLVAIVKYRR